ncbi:hypothetical protein V494_00047 [Pseudogymnoascus sp. VKM F-4513 (FW-928)]|nr:hypothetical protein V494_00047 [Pseudogymnoascus sp. VKM F-4513 (FW-928)]
MLSTTALVALAAGLFGQSLAAPLMVHPGDAGDIVIRPDEMTNGTLVGGTPAEGDGQPTSNPQLGLVLQNNYDVAAVNVYVTGQDSDGGIVFVLPDGTFYYPPPTTSTTPELITENVAIALGGKGTETTLSFPDYVSSGRIWVAAGDLQFYVVDAGGKPGLVEPSSTNPDDPSAGSNWGFAELTNNEGGIYADISFVDFVGMPIGLTLKSADGVQTVLGTDSEAVAGVCSALKEQAAIDGAPWDALCVTDEAGTLLRIMAPADYISLENNAFSDYWTDYVNQVWEHYTDNPLTIDTQTDNGKVACTVVGDEMTCAGDNRGYAKPGPVDIFGCDRGPFAIAEDDNGIHRAVVPRLCAAFVRSTLLIPGGDVQPSLSSENYYTVSPTNYYSKFVHEHELDGLGYAFAYDDVAADGQPSAAGLVNNPNPEVLTVVIGGPAS